MGKHGQIGTLLSSGGLGTLEGLSTATGRWHMFIFEIQSPLLQIHSEKPQDLPLCANSSERHIPVPARAPKNSCLAVPKWVCVLLP